MDLDNSRLPAQVQNKWQIMRATLKMFVFTQISCYQYNKSYKSMGLSTRRKPKLRLNIFAGFSSYYLDGVDDSNA